jgi:hypothetical protein
MDDEKKSLWLALYRAAILESRAERAAKRVERAWSAVGKRHQELKVAAVTSIEEWRNLQSAAHTLDILLGH